MTFFSGLHDLDAPPAASTVHLPIQVQFFGDRSITRYNTMYFIQFVLGMGKVRGNLESPGNFSVL